MKNEEIAAEHCARFLLLALVLSSASPFPCSDPQNMCYIGIPYNQSNPQYCATHPPEKMYITKGSSAGIIIMRKKIRKRIVQVFHLQSQIQ